MKNLEKFEIQTDLLLQKQRESRKYCGNQFNEFLSLVQDEIEGLDVTKHLEKIDKLQAIFSIISGHVKQFEQDIDKDISYLKTQLEVINQLKKEKDEVKRSELVNLMMEGEEIPDTEKFKEELEAEAIESKESFFAMLNDLKQTLIEGSVDELLIYFQEIGSEQEPTSKEGYELKEIEDDVVFGSIADEGEKEIVRRKM